MKGSEHTVPDTRKGTKAPTSSDVATTLPGPVHGDEEGPGTTEAAVKSDRTDQALMLWGKSGIGMLLTLEQYCDGDPSLRNNVMKH